MKFALRSPFQIVRRSAEGATERSLADSPAFNPQSSAGGAALEGRAVQGDTSEFYTYMPELSPMLVRGLLYSAMQGNFYASYDLGSLAKDNSPRMFSNLHEVKEDASKVKFKVMANALPGKKPTARATERRDFIDWALRQFRPQANTDEVGLTGLKYDTLHSLEMPTQIEMMYHQRDNFWVPRAGAWINPRKYAIEQKTKRLGISTLGETPLSSYTANTNITVLDPVKCITSIYKTRSSAMTMSGLLRPLLMFWWPASLFGRKWLLQTAQRWCKPFVDIAYKQGTPDSDIQRMAQLAKAWGDDGVAPHLDTAALKFIELHMDAKESPQNFLVEKYDYYCDLVILREIRASDISASKGTGRGGSAQAGEMKQSRNEAVSAISDFCHESPMDQLISALLILNFGDDEDSPFLVPDDAIEIPATDQSTIVLNLANAGYEVADNDTSENEINAELSEKFGMRLKKKAADSSQKPGVRSQKPAKPEDDTETDPTAVQAESALLVQARAAVTPLGAGQAPDFAAAVAADFGPFVKKYGPLLARLQTALAMHDEPRAAELAHLKPELEAMLADMKTAGKVLAGTASAELLEKMLSQTFFNALATAKKKSVTAQAEKTPEGWGSNKRDFAARDAQRQRGDAAMETVIKEKTDVMHAMDHHELGPVDFRQEGAQHVIERGDDRHAKFGGPTGEEVLRKMPTVIAHGAVNTDLATRKAVVEHEGYRAILAKDYHGSPSNRWLLSGYDVDEKKGGHQ